jgi:hypothetical protein
MAKRILIFISILLLWLYVVVGGGGGLPEVGWLACSLDGAATARVY